MLQLKDGPCEGVYYCRRAPDYLRAVINDKGEKDALDLIDDTPRDDELVFIYRLEGEPGWMHIHGTKVHGFYATGTYYYMPEVDGKLLRDNAEWQKWALAQQK